VAVGSALALTPVTQHSDSTREGMDEVGGDLVVMQKGASDIFGGFIPEATVERIAAIPGVTRVSGALVAFAPSRIGNNVLTFGWPDKRTYGKRFPCAKVACRLPGNATWRCLATPRRPHWVRSSMTSSFFWRGLPSRRHCGLRLDRQSQPGPCAARRSAGSELRPRQVTIAQVSVRNNGDRTELARMREEIEALGNVVAAAPNEVLDHDRNFAILEAVSLAIAVVAAAMSALNVLTALVLQHRSARAEIGIFAAIGWSSGRIMKSIVIEGMLMCVIGCGLGVLLSFLAAHAFPSIPTIGNLISFRPSFGLIAPVIGAAFVLCTLALCCRRGGRADASGGGAAAM